MQIKVKGEMTLVALRQALFEALIGVEEQYAVRHTLDATLFINPTNGFGDEVSPRYANGAMVTKIYVRGPYISAASHYEL